jgi:hypothetical protein
MLLLAHMRESFLVANSKYVELYITYIANAKALKLCQPRCYREVRLCEVQKLA